MSSQSQATKEFGKWRGLLWPIHGYELKKILPMFFLLFLISFNYTVLRDTKDSLVVTASGSGAEAIPFLKVWGVLPAAIIFMIIYAKLSNKFDKKKLFLTTLIPFLVFFGLFSTVLYPARDLLHPHEMADKLQEILPQGMMGLIAVFRNWTFSLFYIMSELWGSVALSLLFWGFANDTTKVNEAKRFYTVFGLGANVALMCSGPLIIYFSKVRDTLPEGVDPWGYSLNFLMGAVTLSILGIMFIYNWIHKNVLTDPRFYNPNEQKKSKKEKPKMSLKDSFKFLLRSKYIGCIAVLVIAYGFSINVIEVTWKGQLKLQYPNPNDYNGFMGMFSTITGAVTIFMMLFVGGNVIRIFGWGKAALVTPVMLMVTGLAFFSFVIFRENLAGIVTMFGTNPLFLAVIIGMIQNIMSKSSKYSLFDPTKEMAYIPLDQESKVKGKAAIDVVGARLGKSGGSLLQQGLILALGSIAAMTPYVAAILMGIVICWMIAAKSLNKQFIKRYAEKEAAEKAKETSVAESVSKVMEKQSATKSS